MRNQLAVSNTLVRNATEDKRMIRETQILGKMGKQMYTTANELARLCGVCPGVIYNDIKRLRSKGHPIQPASQGYILATNATKEDDIHCMRSLLSRQASISSTIFACEKVMANRWPTKKDKQMFIDLVTPIGRDVAGCTKANMVIKKLSFKS